MTRLLAQAQAQAPGLPGPPAPPTPSWLDTPLFNLGETPVSLITLLTMVAVVIATFIISKLVQVGVRRALHRRGMRPEGGIGVASRLIHYAIILVGVGVALQTAGIKLGALFAAGAVFAVGIGFAMQTIAQNFVSGLILLVERTIEPGDIIEVDGTLARVEEMGIRATLVRTLDDEELIVPNSRLVQSTVKNYSLRDSAYRVRVMVGVTYDSDMKLVREALELVGESIHDRLQEYPPQVLLMDFGSSSVDWEVSIWTDDPWAQRRARSQLREAIWWAFKEQHIVIAFPQLDVHLDEPVVEALRAA